MERAEDQSSETSTGKDFIVPVFAFGAMLLVLLLGQVVFSVDLLDILLADLDQRFWKVHVILNVGWTFVFSIVLMCFVISLTKFLANRLPPINSNGSENDGSETGGANDE